MVEWVNELKLGQIRTLCALYDTLNKYRISMNMRCQSWVFFIELHLKERRQIEKMYISPPLSSTLSFSSRQFLPSAFINTRFAFTYLLLRVSILTKICDGRSTITISGFIVDLPLEVNRNVFGYRGGFSTLTINIVQLLKK